MTKLRTPDSIEDAVKQAAALLGDETIAAALTNPLLGATVSASLVGKWGNPEAPQRIALHQAIAIEALLVEAGHAPIFVELFTRLLPAPPAPDEERPDPLREAMRATSTAADLMEGVDRAMVDGRIDRAELGRLDQLTHKVQRQVARLRRVIRAVQAKGRAR
jgi:hypothetical protein